MCQPKKKRCSTHVDSKGGLVAGYGVVHTISIRWVSDEHHDRPGRVAKVAIGIPHSAARLPLKIQPMVTVIARNRWHRCLHPRDPITLSDDD